VTPLASTNWLHRLTEPVVSVQNLENRRQSRLLASLLLALMALTLVVVIFNHVYFWSVPILEDSLFLLGVGFVLFLLVPYQLSRHGRYPLACVLTIIAFSLGIFATSAGEFAEVHFLYNLLLVILIASTFLSIRSMLLVIAANTLGMLLFALFVHPALFSFIIYGPMSTLLLGSILIWLFAHHRMRLETDRQARLAESEERNRVLVEVCKDGVFIESVDGYVLECNPAGCEMYGYTRQEIVALHLRDLLPDDFALLDRITEEHVTHGMFVEFANKKKDGTLFPIEVSSEFFTVGGEKRLIAFVRDITRRKQNEAALRVSEERYRIVSELISDYAYSFRVEPDGSFEDEWITSDSFTRVTGYTWGELDALGPFALFHPDERPGLPAEQEILRRGEAISRDYRIITKSGEHRWLHISRHPVRDEQQNRVVRFYAIAQDITERKLAEAALAEERNLLRALIDHMPDHIFVKDRESRFLMLNMPTARLLHAANPEAVMGKTDFDFFPPEQASSYRADELQILETGEGRINVEHHQLDEQGQESWIIGTKVPLRDSTGSIIGLVGINRDITERKRAEAALAEERNLLRALIDHLPDHIYIKDRLSRFVTVNAPTARYLGATIPEQVIGKNDYDFFPEAVAAQHHADEQRILATGQGLINAEQPQLDKDGHELSILVTKVPLRDKEGNIIGLVGINRDVTERKLAEAHKLKLALERERLNLVGRFVQAVSHDFRTALANIETSRYLTQQNLIETEREKVQPKLDNIQRAVLHLTEQIGNLHTISSLADPDIELCDLNAMVESLIAEQSVNTQEKNVRITFTPTANLPHLVADMDELRRAVRHLLANAITHTPAGGSVMMSTFQVGEQVSLTIRDTGLGIERQHLPHIFDPFYRSDTARSIDLGGVGLGLSIVRMVAEAHGGMISVDSTPGQGSSFTLTLPVTQGQLANS
jgi:PAS domain S-box-containing protein